jgi:hypothetical protein
LDDIKALVALEDCCFIVDALQKKFKGVEIPVVLISSYPMPKPYTTLDLLRIKGRKCG